MKTLIPIVLLSCATVFISCKHNTKAAVTVESPADILKDNTSFNSYLAINLKLLTANYTSFDADGKTISKLMFLRQLTTGNYMFINCSEDTTKLSFKLFELADSAKQRGQVIYAYTRMMYEDYKWVNQKIPAFNFTDINGNKFSSDNTKGKIVVLKCWFIGCRACEEEMTALNQLMSQYKNRNDIVFISLAPDSKVKLQQFFATTKFDYIKIPDQDKFMTKTLKVQEYPTHFIINKQGIIVNVVNSPEEIQRTLRNDL